MSCVCLSILERIYNYFIYLTSFQNKLFNLLCEQVVQKYHWVAMDTEFPGVVARPIGEFRSTADYQYQLLRCDNYNLN